ncbi:MAG: hypothetical protein FWD12_04340 [Alphaproteobacteria bacterium]|nr:hypothetical protein [Alphaproteobacteria bacterium]
MLKHRGVLLALGGTALLLAACSSPAPAPPPPAPAPAPPPAPDFSGVYSGRVAWGVGCHLTSHASLTVEGTNFNLPLNKFYVFNGPVNPDGTLSATVEEVAGPAHKKGRRPGGDLSGQIAGSVFQGTAKIGRCSGRMTLTKAAASG